MKFFLYIPIWLYSNDLLYNLQKSQDNLYIPIWLYSNGDCTSLYMYIFFSLHSNLVIFQSIPLLDTHLAELPLHSNLVIFQLTKYKKMMETKGALHSNLVIFQLEWHMYTLVVIITLHSNLVIFQFFAQLERELTSELYIPIWLYSNI